MPISPDDLKTGGALQGQVAHSLLRWRESASLLKAGDLIGSFRIVRELGRGDMAVVYLAERDDGEYRQQVALKWLQAAQADDRGELLFRRERQALADLNHPNIARLLDGGRSEQGRPWFAMEFVDGAPLDQHCIDDKLTLPQRLELFVQVCAAVAFAHARGVIHRDIKPSNVLVDAGGQTKLLEFGIAQMLGDTDALATSAFSPGYASPEQMRGDTPTIASDVYQLGRLLAALLSVDHQERSDIKATEITRLSRASTVQISSPSDTPTGDSDTVPANLPRDLGAMIRRACGADPSERYPTADAFAADIRAFLQRRPVSARPRHAGYIAQRFVQRHPLATLATTLAVLVAIVATLVFTERLRVERDAAEHQARIATSVVNFMRDDLLAAADPAAAPGQELSVREALDAASNTAETRFDNLPLEHATIRQTLAVLYSKLGRFKEAEREARRAVKLTEASTAPLALRVRGALILANGLIANDHLDEAERLLSGMLGTRHPKQADPRWAIEARVLLGDLYDHRGEYQVAYDNNVVLLEEARRTLGVDDPLSLIAAENTANNLQMLGRQDEALPLLQQVHDVRNLHQGDRHPATLQVAHALGVLMRHRGDSAAALKWLEPTLAKRRDVLGTEHPLTLATANETATALQHLHRFDEAETLFKNTLNVRERVLGEEHLYTRNSMSNLGLLYVAWNKLGKRPPTPPVKPREL